MPGAELGDYKGLEVGRREPAVNPDEVRSELERVREALASLETVERAATAGDFVVIDFTGRIEGEAFEGGEERGFLVELGSGRLVGDFEQQLVGARAGERRDVRVSFPDDYAAEHLAGRDAVFEVEVKEVKEKRLPELDDELAVEAGGYDSSTSCAPRSRSGWGAPRRPPSRASSARPRWMPWLRTRRSRSHPSSSTPRRTRCGIAPLAGCRRRASIQVDSSSCRASPKRSSSRTQSPRRRPRSSARRCWPRSSRRRASR